MALSREKEGIIGNEDHISEGTGHHDAMIGCAKEAEGRIAQSWKALRDSECPEGLKKATASIGWSIELMCMGLEMDYHPFRSWLDKLVARIPPESVDCVFAERYYEMARQLFFATKKRVAGMD